MTGQVVGGVAQASESFSFKEEGRRGGESAESAWSIIETKGLPRG